MDPPAVAPELIALVQREARRMWRQLPANRVGMDELVAFANLGLAEALRRYDPRLGNIETFCRYRVRGAIFDGLRGLGWLSRRHWEAVRRAAIAHASLGAPESRERMPEPTAVADAITALASMILLDMSRSGQGEVPPDPETANIARQDISLIRHLVDRLAHGDREILTAIYDFDETGDSGAKLAERLDTSRSSISRRHLRILERLRRLAEQEGMRQ